MTGQEARNRTVHKRLNYDAVHTFRVNWDAGYRCTNQITYEWEKESASVLCINSPSSSSLSAAAACVQPAEEVRARRAEGPTAHAQTLRTRAHGRPQEGGADSAAGTCL